MKKFKTWYETSASGSKYYNFDIVDETLKDEFETEIGYTTSYSVRFSDHKRPSVVQGMVSYEHHYLYDTRDEENFEMACKYLDKVLTQYCNAEIDINDVDDLFFDVNYQSIKQYLEK